MTEKPQTFLITVAVLEGRYYAWSNMDSAVIVKVDNKKRCTAVRYSSDDPFYNEYFVFEFFTTYEKMMNKNMMLTVIRPRSISRTRKILGYFTLDIGIVWAQKNHQFYHKWGILSPSKNDTFSGPRGYIKVDISILVKGEVPKIPVHIVNDEIEGNLLLPEGPHNERLKAIYVFDIFRCENLVEKHSTTVYDTENTNNKKTGATTHIEITFIGVTVKTSVKKNTCFPVYNEKLKIIDLFPPLCQRIKIDMCYGDSCVKKHVIKYINLRNISSDKEEGFLPTFGPTFLHMYFNNVLEGYAGSILMSMYTKLQELDTMDVRKGVSIETMVPLNEQQYFHNEEALLFATIFEATTISRRYCDKQISFRVTFGGVLVQKYLAASGESPLMNSTVPQKPKKISKQYCGINFENEKPILMIDTKLPFFKTRMYSINLLAKIARELKEKLEKIEDMFENQQHKTTPEVVDDALVDALDYLTTAGRKYVDIVTSYNVDLSTNLDKVKRCLCIKEMINVVEKVNNVYNKKSKKKTLGKLQNIYRSLTVLIEEVQDCWPDVFLWMICGNKKVACFQIPAREIAYSPVDDEKGQMCGVKSLVCLHSNRMDKINVACRLEVLFWLGVDKHKHVYMNGIPEGFKTQSDSALLSRKLIAIEKYIFVLRVYIFQGKISVGFDRSGFADCFVRILFGHQQKETQTVKVSLTPVWDEMLVFRNIIQYGSKRYIENNVSPVVLELYDRDNCGSNELVGRCSIRPEVKFTGGSHSSPPSQPLLKWYKFYQNEDSLGEVLAAFELSEVSDNEEQVELEMDGKKVAEDDKKGVAVVKIPQDLKPKLVSYRIEVLFWGMRDLRKVNYIQINRPRISVIFGEDLLLSDTIENARRHSNFSSPLKHMTVEIALQKEFVPPLCIQLHDSRRFGVYTYAGVHVAGIAQFLYHPFTSEERMNYLSGGGYASYESLGSGDSSIVCSHTDCPQIIQLDKSKSSKLGKSNKPGENAWWLINCLKKICAKSKGYSKGKKKVSSVGSYEALPQEDPDSDDYDWWTKFFDSLEKHHSSGISGISMGSEKPKLKIYPNELERQPDFNGFTDVLTSFEMFKGKRTGDDVVDEEHVTAVFKGAVKIYRWPPEEGGGDYLTPNGTPLSDGIFHNYPGNHSQTYLLRVYCVRAIGLRPKDLNGKSDPYLWLTVNDKFVKDREHAIARQLDPIFGRCFEFMCTFPNDYNLVVAVWDYDKVTSDDLIGETKIDLENRFYSKHRAHCGIAQNYDESGYCAWRDQEKPSVILQDLCKRWNVDAPVYGETSVGVGFKQFSPGGFNPSGDANLDKEVLALTALRRWQEMPAVGFRFVPEHVETRSLYNPAKPGIEQGKIQMWIDIFPIGGDLPPPKQVNICPRKPQKYELRVIIWNTDDVILDEDDFFIGEKKSDIYVKGWLADCSDAQYTDVHYRSLTGEGNFNWRFIFRFEYLPTENKVVVKKRDSMFDAEPTEYKVPCKLQLQVWDNDTISRDDFLGTLTLELSKLPRGSRVSEKCNLSILDPHAPTLNLFKIRRTKGWWPFKAVDLNSPVPVLTGKVEAELEILTAEEADLSPAGLGRSDPQGLPPPHRPDVSFSWFKNPLKGLKYVCCKLHRMKILKVLLCIILVFMALVAIYAVPGYTVKRILGAR